MDRVMTQGTLHLPRRPLPLLLLFLFSLALPGVLATGAPAQSAGGTPPSRWRPNRCGSAPCRSRSWPTASSPRSSVVTVRPRVDGQIEQVHVVEGQMVRRGQPLFTLDTRLTRAVLAQQEATLARDRAQAARAQADAQRYQSLRGESFASQQRFEQAQADALAAAATVRATEALIAQTRLNLDFATITAEIDGRLGALPIRVGNFVRAGENTALATITQMDPILVQFAVPERWLGEIKAPWRRARATVRARPDQPTPRPPRASWSSWTARWTPTPAPSCSRRASPNADLRLWPGQYVQVTLVPAGGARRSPCPPRRVQTGQQGRFVFVLAPDGTARRRPVELARTVGDRAVVRGRTAAGEKVIVDGAQRVTEAGARWNGRRRRRRRPQGDGAAARLLQHAVTPGPAG